MIHSQTEINFWKFNHLCGLHKCCFAIGSSYVLFNENSGQTHVINNICASVLKALKKSSMSLEEILMFLSENCFEIEDEDAETYIKNMLIELDALGLIEPTYQ